MGLRQRGVARHTQHVITSLVSQAYAGALAGQWYCRPSMPSHLSGPCTLPWAYSLPRLQTHWLAPPVLVHCLLLGHAVQLPQVLSSVGDTQELPQQILPSLQSESMLHSLHSPLTQTFLSAEQHTLLQTVRPARVKEVTRPGRSVGCTAICSCFAVPGILEQLAAPTATVIQRCRQCTHPWCSMHPCRPHPCSTHRRRQGSTWCRTSLR